MSKGRGFGSEGLGLFPDTFGDDPNLADSVIYDTARSYMRDGLSVAKYKGSAGDSVLREGAQKLILANFYLEKLLPISKGDQKKKIKENQATVISERKCDCGVCFDVFDLVSKITAMLQSRSGGGIEDITSGMASMSLGGSSSTSAPFSEPMEVEGGIKLQNQDEVEIYNKITRAIVTKTCGYRTFEDYSGGQPLKTFFEAIGVQRFEYRNFEEEFADKTDTVLLFGPPGTGKTLAAEATADLLKTKGYGASLISISASDIKGRYVGESEKSMSILFQVARHLTRKNGKGPFGARPVVVFIDEIDGLIDEGVWKNFRCGIDIR